MIDDLVKISLMATELGVSTKTIYNWINDKKLKSVPQGYVSRTESYEVWLQQKDIRKVHSYFISVQGIIRESNGRFKMKKESSETDNE
jgi:predicted DNA-binding transcriptional regulator AlpA